MRLTIQLKLFVGFGTILLLMSILATVAIRGMADMDDQGNDVTDTRLPILHAAGEAESNLLGVRENTLSLVIQTDKVNRDKDIADQKSAAKAFDDQIAALKKFDLSADERRLLGDIEKLRDTMRPLEDQINKAALAGDEPAARALLPNWRTAGDRADDSFNALIDQVKANADQDSAEARKSYVDARAFSLAATGIALALGLAIAIYLARAITVSVRRVGDAARQMAQEDLPSLVKVAQALANGDLTQDAEILVVPVPVTTSDEIGEMAADVNRMIGGLQDVGVAFATMGASLRDAIGQVQVATVGLSSSSDQLSEAAGNTSEAVQQVTVTMTQIAAGAQEQAVSAQETGQNVEQLLGMIEQVARSVQSQARAMTNASATATQMAEGVEKVAANAQSVAVTSQQTTASAAQGAQAVEQTVQGMREIRQVVSEAVSKVEDLGNLSEKIGAVVETIDDIAEQTNLLALNAAIEAARAGEHGKGFAVVADEVRKLAERSQKETRSIGDLIRAVQNGTRGAVTAMDEGARKVEAGSEQANQAGQALGEILQAVGTTVRQIEEIAGAAQEMSLRGREVGEMIQAIATDVEEATAATEEMGAAANGAGNSIQVISATTEDASASIEEISASAEEMAATAEQLKALVARFRLTADAGDSRVNDLAARRRPPARRAS